MPAARAWLPRPAEPNVPITLPLATESLDPIIDLIQRLIDNGLAYEAGGDVYYRVSGFPSYGRLSGQRVEELVEGARVEPGEHKESAADFALWKSAKPGEPQWDSPWGPGRPGWHIECSAMSMKYLGPSFDVHGGGMDEIATHEKTKVAEWHNGEVHEFTISPKEAGLPVARLADVQGGTPEQNAEPLKAVISGAPGPHRDIVLMNAGAGFVVADWADNIRDGVAMAAAAIDDGSAMAALEALVRITNHPL